MSVSEDNISMDEQMLRALLDDKSAAKPKGKVAAKPRTKAGTKSAVVPVESTPVAELPATSPVVEFSVIGDAELPVTKPVAEFSGLFFAELADTKSPVAELPAAELPVADTSNDQLLALIDERIKQNNRKNKAEMLRLMNDKDSIKLLDEFNRIAKSVKFAERDHEKINRIMQMIEAQTQLINDLFDCLL